MVDNHSQPNNKYGFNFRDWDIYKDTRLFRKEIKKLTKTYPEIEKYALVSQTIRALDSIVLNIAEGANKNTDKDTRLYINRAHCSLDEVVSCLDCALDDAYITEEQHNQSLEMAASLARRLRKFTSHLSQSSQPRS
jgi:four helix bundle protein